MASYTPLFDSLTKGTLCGKWPDIGLWPIILSLADRRGEVDVTPQYISMLSGLSEKEVCACLERFCQPDPNSRTQDAKGRRLIPLDPDRQWGWKIVNYQKYADKVRLLHKNAREIESGKNAARMRDRRRPPETAGDRRGPDKTAPQSQSQSQSHTEPPLPPLRSGVNSDAWDLYVVHRKELKAKKLTARGATMAQNKLATLSAIDQMRCVEMTVMNGWIGLFPEKIKHGTRNESFEEIHERVRKRAGLA